MVQAAAFPITKERVKNHFTYNWWKYLLLVLLGFFFWDLLYTTTRYQPPENLKVEWYYEGNVSDAKKEGILSDWLEEVHLSVLPDMEEVTFTSMGYDETYGDMQIMVWAAAAQGDLYMVTQDRMRSMGGSGSFEDLQPYVDSGLLQVEGIDCSVGYVTDDEGNMILAGIPIDSLTGFSKLGIDCSQKAMCLLGNNGNSENTVKLMNVMIEQMKEIEP